MSLLISTANQTQPVSNAMSFGMCFAVHGGLGQGLVQPHPMYALAHQLARRAVAQQAFRRETAFSLN